MIDAGRICDVRKMRGLTQIELANAAGVGVATIQRCEQKGKISLAIAEKICSALGIEVPLRIATSKNETMWVKPSTRLPIEKEHVLCVVQEENYYYDAGYVTETYVCEGFFERDLDKRFVEWWICTHSDVYQQKKVIAWMPIPEYTEGGE